MLERWVRPSEPRRASECWRAADRSRRRSSELVAQVQSGGSYRRRHSSLNFLRSLQRGACYSAREYSPTGETCDHDWSACQAVALGRMHILRHCRKAPGPRFGRMKSGEKCQDRCCLNLQPFRQGQRVIQFYPKIADGALQLGMAQEKLAGSEVPGFAIEQRDLRSPQAVTAVGGRF